VWFPTNHRFRQITRYRPDSALTSVAEVRFWTAAENWNRQNRTDSSVLFRFSPATPAISSVLGSQISQILRTGSGPVRTGPNRLISNKKTPGNNQEIMLIFDINSDVVGISTPNSHHQYALHRSGQWETTTMTGEWAVVQAIPQKCKVFILKAKVTNSLHSLTTQEEFLTETICLTPNDVGETHPSKYPFVSYN